MIEFDGISFNELISRRIMAELGGHDPSYSELAQDQVPNRVTRYSFMAAIAKINGLPFFPKVAEFCDGTLHATCDATVMTRGFFAPLCLSGPDKLIVAIANPWSPLARGIPRNAIPQPGNRQGRYPRNRDQPGHRVSRHQQRP